MMSKVTEDCVYIVILNWNGWSDTIGCLESAMRSRKVNFRVVVCDNNSNDQSLHHIDQWSRGNITAPLPDSDKLAHLITPALEKPIATQHLRADMLQPDSGIEAQQRLIVIDNQVNGGFAAGNNVGIRFALNQPDMSHIWLLNNDTLVEADCLLNMMHRLQDYPGRAICGSRIMFFDDPTVIQALGGNRFNKWTGIASPSIGRFEKDVTALDTDDIERQLDYLCGASILVPREYLEYVGLMEESYFLYYEEIDWVTRARNQFHQCVALDAVVYHKEGGSIGSASLNTTPSTLSEFYMFRNKLRFTWRHFPPAIVSCYLLSWIQVARRIWRGHYRNAAVIVQALLGMTPEKFRLVRKPN